MCKSSYILDEMLLNANTTMSVGYNGFILKNFNRQFDLLCIFKGSYMLLHTYCHAIVHDCRHHNLLDQVSTCMTSYYSGHKLEHVCARYVAIADDEHC